MRIVFISAIISSFLFYVQIPIGIVYIISILSGVVAAILLYPVSILSSSLKELNTNTAERLYTKWKKDSKALFFITNLYILVLLQVINFILNPLPDLVLIFFSIGTLVLIQQFIQYLRSNYLNDLNTLLEEINNDD